MSRGASNGLRAAGAAAAALFLALVAATFSVGAAATGASADTVPCYNQFGQQVPCPTTTLPPPTTAPPPTQPPTTQPPPPTTVRPPVTSPPVSPPTVYYPPVVTGTPTTAPPTTAPTTTAPTTTTQPRTLPTGPPAILGGFNGNAKVTTTTIESTPPSTATEAAVGLPGGGSKGGRLSARFIYAMVLDGLLLMGIGGYVVVRRLHLI